MPQQPRDPVGMDTDELKRLQESFGWVNHQLAEWLGYSLSNVVKMRGGGPIPGPVARALRLRAALLRAIDGKLSSEEARAVL